MTQTSTPTLRITRKFHFSASHRYWVPQWTAQKNEAEFGLCVSPHGHGHNYVLEVTLEGQPDPVSGMIINLTDVKHIVNTVIERYDHKYLNVDHPAFAAIVPTTEQIAIVLGNEIKPLLPTHAHLKKIRLYEQEDLFAEVEYA